MDYTKFIILNHEKEESIRIQRVKQQIDPCLHFRSEYYIVNVVPTIDKSVVLKSKHM